VAIYYGGKNLYVDTFNVAENKFIKLYNNEAWDFFYNHASFESIITCMQGYTKTISLKREFSENMSDKEFLEMIRDDSYRLFNNVILNRFVNLLRYARYSTNKEEREKLKCLLKDYFIPKHKGGKRSLLPNIIRYDLAVELLKRLAKHLSEKCKAVLRKNNYTEKNDLSLKDEDAYDRLKKWAIENKEFRILTLSKDDLTNKTHLSFLMKKPTLFVKDLLKPFASLKTIKRAK
jgi:hypothetical protein